MEKHRTGSILMLLVILAVALGFWYFTTHNGKPDMGSRGTFVYLMEDGSRVVEYL